MFLGVRETKENVLFVEAPRQYLIAGHQFTLSYRVESKDGGEIDLSLNNTVIKWILTDWNDPHFPILTITNSDDALDVLNPPCDFDLRLSSADTYDLAGQYRYQIEITSPLGDVYRPLEGTLVIEARNRETT